MIDSDTKTLVLGSGGLAGGSIMRSLQKEGIRQTSIATIK